MIRLFWFAELGGEGGAAPVVARFLQSSFEVEASCGKLPDQVGLSAVLISREREIQPSQKGPHYSDRIEYPFDIAVLEPAFR